MNFFDKFLKNYFSQRCSKCLYFVVFKPFFLVHTKILVEVTKTESFSMLTPIHSYHKHDFRVSLHFIFSKIIFFLHLVSTGCVVFIYLSFLFMIFSDLTLFKLIIYDDFVDQLYHTPCVTEFTHNIPFFRPFVISHNVRL